MIKDFLLKGVSAVLLAVVAVIGWLYFAYITEGVLKLFVDIARFGEIVGFVPLDSFGNFFHKALGFTIAAGGAVLVMGWIVLTIFMFAYFATKAWGVIWEAK